MKARGALLVNCLSRGVVLTGPAAESLIGGHVVSSVRDVIRRGSGMIRSQRRRPCRSAFQAWCESIGESGVGAPGGPRVAGSGGILGHFPGARVVRPSSLVRRAISQQKLDRCVVLTNENGIRVIRDPACSYERDPLANLPWQWVDGAIAAGGVWGFLLGFLTLPYWAGANKKKIVSFTDRSRARLMWYLREVKWSVLCAAEKNAREGRAFFITLTYATLPDGPTAKRNLNAFLVAMRREFPGCGAVWKMENQAKRSRTSGGAFACHFHLLLDTKEQCDWEDVRVWVRQQWDFGRTDVYTAYRTGGGLLAYLGKYLGKESDGCGVGFGRYWGRVGRLPLCESRAHRSRMSRVLRVAERVLGKSRFLSRARREGVRGLSIDSDSLGKILERDVLTEAVDIRVPPVLKMRDVESQTRGENENSSRRENHPDGRDEEGGLYRLPFDQA